LIQTFASSDGTRTNVYTVKDDQHVVVDVTLRSPRLSVPVSYALTYERQH
jgi:hypothetical protein